MLGEADFGSPVVEMGEAAELSAWRHSLALSLGDDIECNLSMGTGP